VCSAFRPVSVVTRRSYPSITVTTTGGHWDAPLAQWIVPSFVGQWTFLIPDSTRQRPCRCTSTVTPERRDRDLDTTSRCVYSVLSRMLYCLLCRRAHVRSLLVCGQTLSMPLSGKIFIGRVGQVIYTTRPSLVCLSHL